MKASNKIMLKLLKTLLSDYFEKCTTDIIGISTKDKLLGFNTVKVKHYLFQR